MPQARNMDIIAIAEEARVAALSVVLLGNMGTQAKVECIPRREENRTVPGLARMVLQVPPRRTANETGFALCSGYCKESGVHCQRVASAEPVRARRLNRESEHAPGRIFPMAFSSTMDFVQETSKMHGTAKLMPTDHFCCR
jgi:hypothetical protein